MGKGLKFSLANLITSWRNKQADEIDLFSPPTCQFNALPDVFFLKLQKSNQICAKFVNVKTVITMLWAKKKSDVLPLTCQFNASLDTNCWKVNLCLDEDSAQNEGIRNNQIFRNCLKPKSSTKKTVLVLVKTSTKLNEQAKWGTLCNM